MSMSKRAAIYARVSTPHQVEEQTIESQVQILRPGSRCGVIPILTVVGRERRWCELTSRTLQQDGRGSRLRAVVDGRDVLPWVQAAIWRDGIGEEV